MQLLKCIKSSQRKIHSSSNVWNKWDFVATHFTLFPFIALVDQNYLKREINNLQSFHLNVRVLNDLMKNRKKSKINTQLKTTNTCVHCHAYDVKIIRLSEITKFPTCILSFNWNYWMRSHTNSRGDWKKP